MLVGEDAPLPQTKAGEKPYIENFGQAGWCRRSKEADEDGDGNRQKHAE